MTITLYRIIPTVYADRAFTGEGAKIINGRWHPIGIPMVYTAMSEASAILEILVHQQCATRLKRDYSIIEATLDNSLIKDLQLQKHFDYITQPRLLRRIGKDWFEGQSSVGLKVPSAVVLSDFNVLLNPTHTNFKQIDISKPRAAYFDERLMR